MSDPDFNLLVALDVLLSEASVAGAARRLNLSTSAMSRTLSRLRDVTGDPILVRAGRNMVLTPWAEATRDRARRAVHDARAVLQPSTETFSAQNLARLFTIRANDGFVVAFGPALIAAVATPRRTSVYASRLSRKKRRAIFGKGLVDLEIGVQSNMGPEIRLQRLFEDRFVGVVRKGHPLAKQAEIGVSDYVAWGHVVASPEGALHGSVDDALAELGGQNVKLRASYRDFRQHFPWRWNRILLP
ncbi:LysR family transcriptional regulator [Klebsiella pneumoniae]|nr:LysR family transcriptional regulator [Klebsiella pneumoniae]